jgi:hypothetical protein
VSEDEFQNPYLCSAPVIEVYVDGDDPVTEPPDERYTGMMAGL